MTAPANVATPVITGLFKMRAGQREFMRGIQQHRIAAMLTRRQYGKTTNAAMISLRKMMKRPGHTVVFGSVKLDLAREIVRKEAEAMQKVMAHLASSAREAQMLFDAVDAANQKSILQISPDDFAELYEAQRLEFRLRHSNTTYSRTKVVAITPAAVGETGDAILDEVGRVRNFRECWEAMKPIISSNPDYRAIFTTTPPPDDTHYSFELLAPPIDAEFPVNPAGNWYRSDLGVWVLRVDAWDAAADGVKLYDDDTGAPISPDESRAADIDKDAWDRNYGVKFVFGGTAAVGLLQLDAAQRRGVGECFCCLVTEDADFESGLAFLAKRIGPGRAGIGVDLATTEKESSNPTSVTVMEEDGINVIGRVTFVWKTKDPAVMKERLRRIVETVAARPEGGRARRMAIDATNERLWSEQIKTEFAGLLPVELVIQSETVGGGASEKDQSSFSWAIAKRPGKEPIKLKALLGGLLVGTFNDNQITIAPERYIKTDIRLVKSDRGTYVADLGAAGEHGDCFDSLKLALHALKSNAGAIVSAEGIVVGKRKGGMNFKPRRLLAA